MIFKDKVCKTISTLIIIAFILPVFAAAVKAEDTNTQKKVRVGYMLYEGYQNGQEGEAKSGSAYEYYQRIKSYTDWEYVYVYGSINDMFKMLENGEIDIMSCVTYSEERSEKYLFSEEAHGSEAYYLYTHLEDEDITPANLKSLEGKRVGVTLGSYQEKYFRDWCDKEGISCNIVSYTYIDDMRTALTNKEVDAIIDVHIFDDGTEITPWKCIYRFKAELLYFAVNKDRPDLLKELNDAQAYIISIDEYYGYDIMKKYHDGINYNNTYLTPGQKKYLKNCGTIKVGYLEGTNPLSFTNKSTGKMDGLCAEYLNAMSAAYGIKFDTYVYNSENDLIDDLRSEKIDVIFPLGMGYWAAEELGLSLSMSICKLPMTAIYMNVEHENMFQKIAVNRNSPTQDGYARQYYPEAEIYYVENTNEALEAVEEGRADVYFVRSSSLEFLSEGYEIYDRFRVMSVQDDMEAFMATRNDLPTLSIILDKGISLLTDTQRDSAKFRYTYEVESKVSLWQAIKDNFGIVAGLSIIIILMGTVLLFISRLQSNKKYMKKLVAERDKAEKAEHAKTEFLSHMSHDIRTPMNAIIGFTNFIKDEEDISKIKSDYIPKIEMASNHLLMLINDVLEMSRIDNGKLVFKRSINDMEAIIESVIDVMRIQAEKKGLKLSKEINVRDRIVNCDQNHLSRVILNLLSNSVKFTPSGGSVTISVNQLPEAPVGYALYEVKVSDTGIGMEPEFLERVFEPFERERTSTISGMQGTGLGMAIVKSIIDTAGDTISVESTPGEGTTFTLIIKLMLGDIELSKIPVVNNEDPEQYTIEELKEYFNGKRILLVEDNEFNSTIAYTILENAGFLVESAENGQIAVQKVVQAPSPDYYDAVVMDIQMPVMDGYEATRIIRSLSDERANVKIIAVTANAFENDKEKAKEAGMDGHVSKPLDIDTLYRTLLDITK